MVLITATVNGNPYFTVTVDQATGDYTVDVLSTRQVVDLPLNFANIAPGNYDNGNVAESGRFLTASPMQMAPQQRGNSQMTDQPLIRRGNRFWS